MFKSAKRVLRLWRAYRGRCPYCGSDLEFRKRSSKLEMFYKVCPDGHFGIENHGDGRVTYHDNQGDPVALFHDHKLTLLKGSRAVSESAITTKIVRVEDTADDEPHGETEDEDLV